jgi:HK97 family phage portal protein
MKLFYNGEFHTIDDSAKGIITIPKWAERFNEGQRTDMAERYKQSPTVFTCVQIRAQALSAIPWGIYDKTDEELLPNEREKRADHPAAILLEEVNPEMNWIDLARGTESDMNVFGGGFWLKEAAGEDFSKPDVLIKLEAGKLQVDIKEGKLVFIYNGTIEYPREQVVYFHDYNPTESWQPLSPLAAAKYAINTEINSAKYMDEFFLNNAIPPVIFYSEQSVPEQEMQRTIRWWERKFKGVGKQHKVGFVDKGLKPEILGYPTKDLALKDVRAEARRDICAALRVPPALAGAWEAANYATSQEQRDSFYEETVVPRAEYMAGVINAELIEGYGDNVEFAWDYHALPVMQDDKNLEAERVGGLVTSGVITPVAGALDLGYDESEAGIGPTQVRIVDEEADIVPGKTKMAVALGKWEKKACNALHKGRAAQVPFESEYITEIVSDVIYERLDGCNTKAEVQKLFGKFKE